MRSILLKLLGLSDLAQSVTLLKAELDSVKSELETLEKQIEDTEIPDPDDFVLDCDFDDKVRDIIRDEIADKDDIVQEVRDEIQDDIDEKVQEAVDDAIENVDKSSFGDEEELKILIKKVLSKAFES
jgi:hypothetical protein